MKYKIQIAVLFCLLQLCKGCSGADAPECFKRAGKTISYEVEVADFTTLNIGLGVEVVVKQGAERKVVIETCENLKPAITAKVTGNELMLTNDIECNWVRDYKTTTVYVTTPNLDKIYSASQFTVKSDGVLGYPSLTLQSGLISETASGVFELTIDSQNLLIEDNQSSYYIISGAVDNLSVNFYSGDARFEGTDLIAQKIKVFQRSTNDIIANPQVEVTGEIYSIGNLVLKNKPPLVDVKQLYTGRIIYK